MEISKQKPSLFKSMVAVGRWRCSIASDVRCLWGWKWIKTQPNRRKILDSDWQIRLHLHRCYHTIEIMESNPLASHNCAICYPHTECKQWFIHFLVWITTRMWKGRQNSVDRWPRAVKTCVAKQLCFPLTFWMSWNVDKLYSIIKLTFHFKIQFKSSDHTQARRSEVL